MLWNIRAASSTSTFSSLPISPHPIPISSRLPCHRQVNFFPTLTSNVTAGRTTIFWSLPSSFRFSQQHSQLPKMSRHPTIKWAQRSDKVYLTVELPDAKDVKVKLEPEGKFIFSAKKDGGTTYEVDLELYDKINVEGSKVSIGVRSIVYVIVKAEKEWWPRLVKQEGKAPVFLKVDWDKWVDEDEEHVVTAKAGTDFDGMDFSKLGMGGNDDYDFDMDEPKGEEGGAEKEDEAGKGKVDEGEPAATSSEEAKA